MALESVMCGMMMSAGPSCFVTSAAGSAAGSCARADAEAAAGIAASSTNDSSDIMERTFMI